MDAFDKWQAVSTFVVAVSPWFFPELDILWKVIFVLSIILISSLLYIYRLFRRISTAEKELMDVCERHKAISARFEKKQATLNQYRAGFISLEYLLTATAQSSSRDRLTTLYQYFLDVKAKLVDEER